MGSYGSTSSPMLEPQHGRAEKAIADGLYSLRSPCWTATPFVTGLNTTLYAIRCTEKKLRDLEWNLIEFAGAGTIWVVLANNWLRWRGRESSSYCYRSARSRSHQWENAGSTTAGFSCYILCFFDATCNGTLLFWFCIVQRATTYRTVVYNI